MSPELLRVLAPVWACLGATILVYGVRARRREHALTRGCFAVAVLWVLAGALVNAAILVFDGSYSGFADGAYVDFVRDTWESLVVPHQVLFIGLLVAFEALAGGLVLVPGRARQAALVALIGFNVALLSFGWGFCLWSIPVGTGLVLLLRAERRRGARPAGAGRPVPVARVATGR
jgi:hypothetical protein